MRCACSAEQGEEIIEIAVAAALRRQIRRGGVGAARRGRDGEGGRIDLRAQRDLARRERDVQRRRRDVCRDVQRPVGIAERGDRTDDIRKRQVLEEVGIGLDGVLHGLAVDARRDGEHGVERPLERVHGRLDMVPAVVDIDAVVPERDGQVAAEDLRHGARCDGLAEREHDVGIEAVAVDGHGRVHAHGLRADIALEHGGEGLQLREGDIIAVCGMQRGGGAGRAGDRHAHRPARGRDGHAVGRERGGDGVARDVELRVQRVIRPREVLDAVHGGLRRELAEKLRVGIAGGSGVARAGELSRPGDEVFDLAARAADVDVPGRDVHRAADVLGRDGHAVDRGGERGVIAAGGAGHGGRAREAQRPAERDVEGRGFGGRRVHEGAHEAQRAGQVGVAAERLHLEAAVVRRGGDVHARAAEVERHVRARQAQGVRVGEQDGAGDHRVVEPDGHAGVGLLHGDVFRQRGHAGRVERDVRDLHAEVARDRARRVDRVGRAQDDLLAAEGDVHALVAVGGEEIDARDVAAHLEGGLVNVHVRRQAVGLAVGRDGEAVVRRAAEEVAHDGLRVLPAVGELAEVVGVIFRLEVVLELGLVVGHGAEVREHLGERARAVEAAEAGHGHGVALHGVHLQQIPIGVNGPDHVHGRKFGVFRRAAVGAHLVAVIRARAGRLEVEGEGVGAVVVGGHGGVEHRIAADDVVAEVARVLPVGVLVVLLRDGHDLVAPGGGVAADGIGLAHEDRPVLEVLLLAELDEHARADGLGKDTVARDDAHVVHGLVVVDEADLCLRLAGRLGAVGLLIHDAGRNVDIVLCGLAGGVAVRAGERCARAAGAVIVAAADCAGNDDRRRDCQRQQRAADDIGALAVLVTRRARGALRGYQLAVGDVRRGLVCGRLAPP